MTGSSVLDYFIMQFMRRPHYIGAGLMVAAFLLVLMKKEGRIVMKKASTERLFNHACLGMFIAGMVLLVLYAMMTYL
jgi:hypothetical protein